MKWNEHWFINIYEICPVCFISIVTVLVQIFHSFLFGLLFIHPYASTFFNLSFHEINIWYQLFLSSTPYSWLLYSLWYCIIGFLVLNTVSGCICTFLTRWLGIRGRMGVSMKYSLNILMPLNLFYIFYRILDVSSLGKNIKSIFFFFS